ncbi:hypothetical protein NQ318_016778 [Aromia moschata]|uniref:WW domain-containing protein n=1 Tax=Aromia moschata TaxID=1265417 RepID=A0AAV8Y4B1_9CUCU|nr:hypothetical protein NQ318_016778 [Aromia moschata]
MAELQDLPPGWACQVDPLSGKFYYINHYTKTTTWDDPRARQRHFQGTNKHLSNVSMEHIPLQHGSPDLRRNYVYPRYAPRMSPLTVKSPKVQDSTFTIPNDTDEAVAKISVMFPTVSETHIRLLLKKYMKSIFPEADETVILEILQNNDNKIQKTSDILQDMGFAKRTPSKLQCRRWKRRRTKRCKSRRRRRKSPVPRSKLRLLKRRSKDLQKKYKDVAEHLITIALESVNFDENRANQILKIMIQEDTETNNKKKEEEVQRSKDPTSIPSTSTANLPVSQSRQSLKSLLKEKPEKEKDKLFSRIIKEHDGSQSYPSKNLTSTMGPNPVNAKGTNEKLLLLALHVFCFLFLHDYIRGRTTSGGRAPKSELRKGPKGLAKGCNASLLSGRSYQPCGPNSELRKGPKFGLAKGSIFSQFKAVIVGDSCGE